MKSIGDLSVLEAYQCMRWLRSGQDAQLKRKLREFNTQRPQKAARLLEKHYTRLTGLETLVARFRRRLPSNAQPEALCLSPPPAAPAVQKQSQTSLPGDLLEDLMRKRAEIKLQTDQVLQDLQLIHEDRYQIPPMSSEDDNSDDALGHKSSGCAQSTSSEPSSTQDGDLHDQQCADHPSQREQESIGAALESSTHEGTQQQGLDEPKQPLKMTKISQWRADSIAALCTDPVNELSYNVIKDRVLVYLRLKRRLSGLNQKLVQVIDEKLLSTRNIHDQMFRYELFISEQHQRVLQLKRKLELLLLRKQTNVEMFRSIIKLYCDTQSQ